MSIHTAGSCLRGGPSTVDSRLSGGRASVWWTIADARARLAEADGAALVFGLIAIASLGIAVKVALSVPLSTAFDEWAHYSFLRAFLAHPTPFPDRDSLRMLADDLIGWSSEPNYITHPPLYYALMAPLAAAFPTSPVPIRLVDVFIAISGPVLAGVAGLGRLKAPRERLVFAVAVFGPPASIGVAGLVNNDDLMIFEIGVLCSILFGTARRPALVALLVAALGWTKLTGFAAAVLFVGFIHLGDIVDRRVRLVSPTSGLLSVGVLVGLIPSFAEWISHGRPVWVPAQFPSWFEVLPAEVRVALTPLDFAWIYVSIIGERLPYRPDLFGAVPLLGLLFAALGLSLVRRTGEDRRDRRLIDAAAATVVAFVGLHVTYAWFSATGSGSIADLQARYLLAVWPILAFAVAKGATTLPGRAGHLFAAVVIGGLVIVSAPAYSILRFAGFG